MTVANLDTAVAQAFTRLNYQRMGDIRTDHPPPGSIGQANDWIKWLFKPPIDQRRAHIHVRIQGRANQRYPLLFRDYLRAHPQTATAYAELKRRLAQHLADPGMYPEVKDPAVDLIYFAAEEWATAVGWKPGPTDC